MARNKSVDDLITIEVMRRTQAIIDDVSEDLGPPADAHQMTEAEEDEWWEWRDVRITPDMLVGKPPDEATALLHPKRVALIERGRPDPDEQVAFAKRVAARIARRASVPEIGGMLPVPGAAPVVAATDMAPYAGQPLSDATDPLASPAPVMGMEG